MSQITTHVLDTTNGKPAKEVPITLSLQIEGEWQVLAKGVTDKDGRIGDLLSKANSLVAGLYRMSFDTGTYFMSNHLKGFYPYVDIVFSLEQTSEHYHIPLLISPYGYSTYRGS